eukprot:jgi/Orpsp1_1/1192177/evm.model.d7180000091144.1
MEAEANNNNTETLNTKVEEQKVKQPEVDDKGKHPEENDSSESNNEDISENDKELGSEFLVDVSPDTEDLDLTHTQISDLEKINVNRFTLLKTLSLRQNVITKISGLDKLVNLEELDLYDNRIKHIENLDTLVNL